MHLLNDDDCPQAIRDYVRNNPDIEVYEHVKRGAVGEVYFARRTKLGDDVVLKFYHAQPGFDSTEEAVILRNIEHPNVLKVHHLTHVPPNFACFLTPKISGGDLQAQIEAGGMSSKQALKYVENILVGLNELHSTHGMVHRDLKPGNILVDTTNKKAIIADLGAVKKIPASSLYTTDSKATWIYLPPEGVISKQYYFQSDIYQVGVILYQLLGGHFPIENPSEWLTVTEKRKVAKENNGVAKENMLYDFITEKIKKGSLVNPKSLPRHLDIQFRKAVSKATSPHHTSRFRDCSEFLAAIYSLLRTMPDYTLDGQGFVVAHDDGRDYRIQPIMSGRFQLEKRTSGKAWRTVHTHTGEFDDVLRIARDKG